jgi:hypothetical protein
VNHVETLRRPVRSIGEALADSLKAAQQRLPIGEPAQHIDDRRAGIVRAVFIEDDQVMVSVEVHRVGLVTESAGYWAWAIA